MEIIWEIKDYDRSIYKLLKNKLDISPTLIKLLIQRGIDTKDKIEDYLYGNLYGLSAPYDLSGMDRAVARIKRAVADRQKVLIYGDYDVDGICSTVILLESLQMLGLDADYYVPNRFSEGYGLNIEAIKDIAAQGYDLVITVDCGISSIKEVELANNLGLDFIITDHHNPSMGLPQAEAIINPKLDNKEKNQDLCGAGIAYQLALALNHDIVPHDNDIWLDLVALATVADIVALRGDNRIFLKYGLNKISNGSRIGLKALLSVANLSDKTISVWHIGFILAPRLNAAGRMASASLAIDLLQTKNYQLAVKLAQEVSDLNNQRRSVEDRILKEATLHIETELNLAQEKILVLAGDNWHQGVIGIVASRLVDRYNRPVIVISWEGDLGRGSGRSMGNFDLYQALAANQEHLEQFGGHKLAAGLSLHKNDFANFKKDLLAYYSQLLDEISDFKTETIDLELDIGDINQKLIEELKLLEPCGEGNPLPKFLARNLEITNSTLVGKNKDHFKCQVWPGSLDAIAFNRPYYMEQPFKLLKYDMAFTIAENEFLGQRKIQLRIRNIKPTIIPDDPNLLNVFKKPQAIIKKIISELEAKRPVTLIYPTSRTLMKHYLDLRKVFNPSLIKRLHGNIYIENRNRVLKEWQEGNLGIFLLTRSYLDYFLLHNKLPDYLKYMVDIWPDLSTSLVESDGIEVNYLFEPKEINIVKEEMDISEEKRAVVYTNRPTTIKNLTNKLENIFVLAGQDDYRKRRNLRQQFNDSNRAYLLLDGAYDIYGDDIENIDKMLLADVPFSYYEGLLAMYQISATEEIKLISLFDKANIESNKKYLAQNYPNTDTVRQVLNYFKNLQTEGLKCDVNDLNLKVANFINKNSKDFNILPVLWILADLGLCEIKNQATTIEIKFLRVGNKKLNISSSPYYLEGIAEKTAFIEWEKMITNG